MEFGLHVLDRRFLTKFRDRKNRWSSLFLVVYLFKKSCTPNNRAHEKAQWRFTFHRILISVEFKSELHFACKSKRAQLIVQSNSVNTDTEGTMDSVHINRVSLLSGFSTWQASEGKGKRKDELLKPEDRTREDRGRG